VAYKAVYFQLVGGIMSETSRLIEATLRQMRRRVPKVDLGGWFALGWSLLIDIVPFNYKNKRLYATLKGAYALRRQDQEVMDRRFPVIRLYLVACQLHMRERSGLALMYHNAALGEALKGRGSPASMIKAVAERAALLGQLGFTRISYRFLDISMDVAKACNLRSVYGYVALLRVLTIDYVKGRHEEISDHLKEAMVYLRPNEDRLAYGQGLLFKMFRELTRCNFTALYRLGQLMPDTIPTRNWLSPRAVAMMLYGYLLQGSRDNIVLHGEMYLKRRQKVAGREGDLFVRVIHTLIAFARGEIDKTRQFYVMTMRDFIGRGHELLLPFEEDFIGIFAFTFPILFEQEYARHLMRVQEMEVILVKLKKRIGRLKGPSRAVPMLLTARATELTLGGKAVRPLYDQALKSSKVAGNNLVQVFAYLWFGAHLLDSGAPKRDYIRRAFLLAHKLELKALVEYTRKLMEKRNIHFKEAHLAPADTGGKGEAKGASLPSRLFIEHLNHVCEAADAESSIDDDLEESFKVLAKHYNAGRIFCIMAGAHGEPRLVYPQGGELEARQIIEYTEPYFNIRSTLFLPLNDAPWIRVEGGDPKLSLSSSDAVTTDPGGLEGTSTGATSAGGGDFDGNSTVVVTMNPGDAPFTGAGESPAAGNPQNLSTTSITQRSRLHGRVRPSGGLQMSALVPMRSNHDVLGVVFIEDIGNQFGRDTTYCRQELDQFGSQLALMIERKTGLEASDAPEQQSTTMTANAIYQPASYTMEPVAWLRTWHYGRLRAQRETSWFLGLNFGPDHYVIAYCLLSGAESVRERIGSMIWHHLYVIRALAIASGRNQVELNDLREEFQGVFGAVPKAAHLENISLAFSVINRENRTVFSGHFGPSRPFVVGVENVVSPYNDVVLTYANGRDLRYWDVAAELNGPHTYILSYDTHKLDSAPVDTVQKRVATSLGRAGSVEELHRVLSSMVPEASLPRYYVAATLLEEADVRQGEEDGGLSLLDKAE